MSRTVSTITGLEVKELRRSLGLSVVPFGAALGVMASTIYRWESYGEQALSLDPLQESLILGMRDVLARNADVGPELHAAFALYGSTYTLYTLLRLVYAQPAEIIPRES